MTVTAAPTRILFRAALAAGMLVGAAVLVAPVRAIAADANLQQGYQVSPPVTTLTLDPGTSTRQTMKATNLTDTQLTLGISKRNFVAKGEEGEIELTDDANPRYSLAPYFSLGQPTITIGPRATASFDYTISVPADAEPGGRYAAVVFNTQAGALGTGQSGARVRQELAPIVFLRISGQADERLAIDSFATDKSFYEYAPVKFTTRVKNEGNVHEKPTGTITVKNMFGGTTASIKLDEHNVIPGAIRRLENTGAANQGAALAGKFLFGRYTAQLELKNGTVQTLTASTSFTVIPYKLLGIALLVLIVVVFIFMKGRKRMLRAIRILAGRE